MAKVLTVACRKTDECISPRSDSFRYLALLQQQLIDTIFFLSNIVKWHNTNLCDHLAINVT